MCQSSFLHRLFSFFFSLSLFFLFLSSTSFFHLLLGFSKCCGKKWHQYSTTTTKKKKTRKKKEKKKEKKKKRGKKSPSPMCLLVTASSVTMPSATSPQVCFPSRKTGLRGEEERRRSMLNFVLRYNNEPRKLTLTFFHLQWWRLTSITCVPMQCSLLDRTRHPSVWFRLLHNAFLCLILPILYKCV